GRGGAFHQGARGRGARLVRLPDRLVRRRRRRRIRRGAALRGVRGQSRVPLCRRRYRAGLRPGKRIRRDAPQAGHALLRAPRGGMTPANLLTEWARVLFESLADAGLREVVVSPGSRSTPFVHAALACTRLRATSLIDERVAGFFALGQAKVTGEPV